MRAIWASLLVAALAAAFLLVHEGDRRELASERDNAPAPATSGPSSATSAGRAPGQGEQGDNPSRFSISRGPLTLRIERSSEIREGVYLHEIRESAGPNELRVVEVEPSTAVTLDMVGAGERYPELAPTSRMGQRAGAIAAVNGEFFTPPGRPEFLFQSDGTLWQTALHASNLFAISEDEEDIYVRRIRPSITAESAVGGGPSGGGSARPLRVTSWNTVAPKGDRISGYTPIGGSVAQPPARACSLELGQETSPSWTAGRTGVQRTYVVTGSTCRGAARFHHGVDVVLTAVPHSAGARGLEAFHPRDRVRLEWAFGLPNVLDVAGGQPVLVKGGRNVVPRHCPTSFCDAQPRTAVGYTKDGRLLIATVDGRQPGWSTGMSLDAWANVFVQLGAEGALNLDGGGSTTMWVRGRGVVDRPSNPGHRERPVGTALVVLPGRDTDVPAGLKLKGR